jgi:RHS repeat-associated protein
MNRVTSAKTLGTACTAVAGGTLNWGESFTIDAWGNLTGKTPSLCSAESLSTSATALNQLAAATYDSAGNAIANNGVSYAYDAEGRITSAAGTAYVYDGASQRVSKPGKLYWRGTGSDPLAETSATDTNPTRYIFFGGKRIARIDPTATTPKYYVADNLGSTAVVTDYLGNILSESEFYPYGGEQQVVTGDSNTYKFTGKERDTESGNDYFGARYYASTLGRFLSPDWDAKPTAVPLRQLRRPADAQPLCVCRERPAQQGGRRRALRCAILRLRRYSAS